MEPVGQFPHGDRVAGAQHLEGVGLGKDRPSSVIVVRNRARIRDIDSSRSSSQISLATAGVPVSAFTVIARPDT